MQMVISEYAGELQHYPFSLLLCWMIMPPNRVSWMQSPSHIVDQMENMNFDVAEFLEYQSLRDDC